MAFGSRRHPPFHDRNGSTPSAPAPAGRTRPNPQLGGIDVFASSRHQQVQSESSSDDEVDFPRSMASKPQQPGHARSVSHPFPTLFHPKKSRIQQTPDDTTDDDFPRAGQSTSRSGMASKKPSRGPADFTNGNCMTCGGKVRWPKDLSTFRCTICATINDLKPKVSNQEEGQSSESPRPLSLDHTRRLVRRCLLDAFRSFAGHDGQRLSPGLVSGKATSRPSEDYFSRMNPSSQHGRSPSLGNTPLAKQYSPVFEETSDGHLAPNPLHRTSPGVRSYSASHTDARSQTFPLDHRTDGSGSVDARRVFKPVEDYLIGSFAAHANINTSFVSRRPSLGTKSQSQPQMRIKRKPLPPRHDQPSAEDDALVTELDAKMLLVGNLAENAQWWTGGQQETMPRSRSQRKEDSHTFVSSRSPRIDWAEVLEWYSLVIGAARPWTGLYRDCLDAGQIREMPVQERQRFEAIILEAQSHLQRVLLKCTEILLKRPGQLLEDPQDTRFLLLIMANPLLTPDFRSYSGDLQHINKGKQLNLESHASEERPSIGRHSGIIKRILGLISNLSDQCHHQLVAWLSRIPEHLFLQIKDLVGSFVNYRLRRQTDKKVEVKVDLTGGLIPEIPNSRSGASAALLHAALAAPNISKKQKQSPEPPKFTYSDDWQLKAGAKVMALVFAANNLTHVRRNEVSARHAHGHLLATSDFYNTMLDCLDFKTDFEMWESRKGKFAFCQYPFFLSIAAKISILEFDAKRQMHGKARDAFFDSLLTHKSNTQYLFLSVRRECLVEDSLAKVSEVVGSGSEDIKKGLRIEFRGEEGVDAGGLRKEWFQLLVRDVFNPDHGEFSLSLIWSNCADQHRTICFRRGLSVLLLQPTHIRDHGSVFPCWCCFRLGNIQFCDLGRCVPTICLSKIACCCTCVFNE